MIKPDSGEAAALVRLEIRRLPPEEQAELHRLRMTAQEMAIPVQAVWMFLPESLRAMITALRRAVRSRRCTAARLRKRARRARGAARGVATCRIEPHRF